MHQLKLVQKLVQTHRWWGNVADIINKLLLDSHNWERLVKPRFIEWKVFAQFQGMIQRNNRIANENAKHLHQYVT